MMKWIGLTGGIATGKSTVAELIRGAGYCVIDADKVAHQALSPTSSIFTQVVQTFGQVILDVHGEIDRRRLGSEVFKNETLRKKLEALVHPFVRSQVQNRRSDLQAQGHEMAFYDVPLLFEKNMQSDFNCVIVVWCDEDLQLQRLMKRNNLSLSEAKDRIRAQWPLQQKMDQADYLIENNSSTQFLASQVEDVLLKLKSH